MTKRCGGEYNFFGSIKREAAVISYSIEVRKKVKEAFDEKRERALAAAEARRLEVYQTVEGVREIDAELQKTGLKVYSEALKKNCAVPLEDRIAALHEENAELQRARADLLTGAGYPADYLKPKYECERCSDTGYIGIDPCPCLITALRRESYLSSGLGALLSHQTFENFDLSVYPPQSRRMMRFILEQTKDYAERFGDPDAEKNLLFYGGTGLGKTHLSSAAAKRLIDRGFSVVYDTAFSIMRSFEKERFSKNGGGEPTEKYFDCDLLIIDDLGSEFMSSFTHATLYDILNTRINAGKGTLVSTNLSSTAAIEKTYDERIVSRLVGMFRSFCFEGEDIRLLTRRQNLQQTKEKKTKEQQT